MPEQATVVFSGGVLALLLAVPLAFRLILALRGPSRAHAKHHEVRAEFFDRCVQLLVGVTYLLYPILCMRLLKLFHAATFDSVRVLHDDHRLYMDDLRGWQAGGLLFIALFVGGIPAAFLTCLWREVRPCFTSRQVDVNSADAVARVAREGRVFVRYGLLFSKYKPSCWWFELVEMPRKLLLVGSIIFVASGTAAQICYAIGVALSSILVLTAFQPYADARLSFVAWVCQLCTLLTLNCALLLRHDFDPETEAAFEDLVVAAVTALQVCHAHATQPYFAQAPCHDTPRDPTLSQPASHPLPLPRGPT